MSTPTPESAAAVDEVRKAHWGTWATIGLGAVVLVAMNVVQIIVFMVFFATGVFDQTGGKPQNLSPQQLEELSKSLQNNGDAFALATLVSCPPVHWTDRGAGKRVPRTASERIPGIAPRGRWYDGARPHSGFCSDPLLGRPLRLARPSRGPRSFIGDIRQRPFCRAVVGCRGGCGARL